MHASKSISIIAINMILSTRLLRLTYDGLKLAMFGAMSGEHSYDCGAIKICDSDQ